MMESEESNSNMDMEVVEPEGDEEVHFQVGGEELDDDETIDDECDSWGNVSLKKESLVPHIVDEIALEGLDGITLQALEQRLLRRPGLSVRITHKTMDQVWNIIKVTHGLEFYLLPSPRPNLSIFSRSDYLDERGMWYEPLSAPEDIYKYVPIHDKEKNIRGSCATYKTRVPIPGIRVKSYDYAKSAYGNSLVLVASQKLRETALLGSEFSDGTDIFTDTQYGMLERIGRARYEGELTRGKVSLNSMTMDPKTLFYHRKLLIYKELITKQLTTMKFGETRSSSLVSILHLPRFFTPIVPPSLQNARKIIRYLRKKPKMREESAAIKKIFGKSLYRTLVSPEYSKVFREESVSQAELFPELLLKEKKLAKREALIKRTQRVLLYLDPPGDVEAYLPTLKDEGDIHLGNPAEEKSNTLLSTTRGIRNLEKLNLFDTEVHTVFHLIAHGGPDGISLPDIGETLQMLTLPARCATRLTCRLKLAKSTKITYGKTKINKYIFCAPFPVDSDESVVIKSVKKPQPFKAPPTPQVASSTSAVDASSQNLQYVQEMLVKGEYGVESTNTVVSVKMISVTTPSVNDEEGLVLGENPSQVIIVPNEGRDLEIVYENENLDEDDDENDEHSNDADIMQEPRNNGVLARKFIRLSGGQRGNAARIRNITEPKKRKKTIKPPTHEGGVYYDEGDRLALSKKNTQRVTWTVDEDQYMLLLFISSVVFIRKYNLNKLFIFNARQIRDMLHMKSEISTNKTSLAIRRRLHFLIKNPTFKAKYQYYLHDAVKDLHVQENFVQKFTNGLEDPQKIFHGIPTESILEVYDYLVTKYINYFNNPINGSNSSKSWLGRPHNSQGKGRPSSDDMEVHDYDENSADFNASDDYYDDENEYETSLRTINSSQSIDLEIATITKPPYTKLPIKVLKSWTRKPEHKLIIDAEWDADNLDEIEKWISRSVVFTLMFSGDAKDDVRPFLGRIGDSNLEYVTGSFRKLNICTVSRSSHKFGLSTTMRRRLANHIPPESYKIANDFLNIVKEDFRATHPAVSNNSASLFLLTEFLIYDKVLFDIATCKDWFKPSDEECPIPLKVNRKTRVLGEDSFSVSLPAITARLSDDIDSLVYGGPRPNGYADLTYLTNHLLKITPHDENDALDNMESSSRYLLLLSFIKQSEEVGVSIRLLLSKFTRPSLKNGLLYLLSTNQIYMVGIAQRKFVAVEHVLPWTVKIPTSSSDFQRKFHRVVIQPWVTSSGTMNWDLVKVLFTSIIGVLSNHPGIKVQNLIKFLNPVLSGVETMILTEALHHFDLVTVYKLARSNKPNLFSSPTNYHIDKNVDIFLDLEDAYIDLLPFVTMKYAQLQEIFDPEFISRCKNYLLNS